MKIRILFILLILPFISFSQEKPWSLEECIQYAVENSLTRTKQEAQNEIYNINRQEAIGGFFPSVNAGAGVSINFGRGLDPETNTYINRNNFNNNYEISSSMNLFTGFSQLNKAKIAKVNQLRGKDQLQETKDMIALETMEIFFNVLYYKKTVELAQEQLDVSTTDLKRVKRMEELGLKSAPDVAELYAKEAEDQYILTRQKNIYELELIRLKEKMNFPFDENLEILEFNNDLPVAEVKDNSLEVYQQALYMLPKAVLLDKALSIYELEYKISKSSFYPKLSLYGGYQTGFSRFLDGTEYMSFEDQLKNRQGSYVGISLSIPIFNRLSNLSYVKRSRQQLIIAGTEREEILRQLYSEIEQTISDINGLSDEYHHAVKRTQAMEAAHQVNVRKYEEGLISAIELVTSSNRLLQSKIEESYINLKYQIKYRLLEYYKGIPPQTPKGALR